jgi:hypothetical protein
MNTPLKHEFLGETTGAYPAAIFKTGLARAFACLSKLAVVVAVMGLLASPASAQTVRYFSSTTTPTSVAAGSDNTHSITIENCNGSLACIGLITTASQTMKSATVEVPAGFTVISPLSVSATGGKIWTASESGSTIELKKSGPDQLSPGESVTVAFDATAPCEAGFYEWTSAAFNADDFMSTPYDLAGVQPEVEVIGDCEPTGFEPGDFCTYSQGGWGSPPSGGNPGSILEDNFGVVYGGDLVVGTGFAMTFNAASNVQAYLPAGGTPGALIADLTNPTSTSAGVFGGQVTALRLNVDFNDAGIIDGFLGSISGLVLQGTGGSLDGQTVAAILGAAEQALGGGALPAGYTLSSINDLVDELDNAFDDCDPSDWAQIHLTL